MKQEGKPVLVEQFYGEGRGPELIKIHWAYSGQRLQAIDFITANETLPKHLLFSGVQVVMKTPEEVINYQNMSDGWVTFRPACILSFGKSAWLQSFAQPHLEKCSHFQILFYDALFDIICEDIQVREGIYPEN